MKTKRTTGVKSPKALAGPLLKAAGAGDVARVKALLAAGAPPDQRVAGQPTPLIAAARRGHLEVIRALLAAGADASFQHGGKTGTTAFLVAIWHDQFEVACLLVDAGADTAHDWTGKGQNITFEAIDRCNELWVKASAPTAPNRLGKVCKRKGRAANEKASRLFPVAVKLVGKILKAGGRPGRPCLADTAGRGDVEVVRLLLAHGANVNESNQYGTTAFSSAVTHGQLKAALAVLKAGADPNAGNTLSGPPFHAAAVAGNTDLVKAVVAAGADLNFRATVTLNEPVEKTEPQRKEKPHYVLNLGDDCVEFAKAYESTPLIAAVRAGHAGIVRLLVKGGANPEAVDRDGFTAMAWAVKRKRNDLAVILRRVGAKGPANLEGSPLNRLFAACQSGSLEAAQAAIAAGADVNAGRDSTRELRTPLMVAAREGHAAIVDALLKAGANPDLAGREELLSVVSPLMLAARHGHVDAVKRLVAGGAGTDHGGRNLFAVRDKGDAAIHEAARNGHAPVVEALLQAGVQVGARSKWSGDVLAAAVESGDLATVKVVLAAGGKPTADNIKKLLAAARASKNRGLVRELQAALPSP